MLDKKVALITGANRGIGKEIARQMGELGYKVVIGARDPERGIEAVNELKQQGYDVQSVILDVTDEMTINAAAESIESDFGKLDVLVNNAGIKIDGRCIASDISLETLRKTYEINVFGVFAVTQRFLPLLKKSDSGRIVNISSGLGSLTETSDPNSKSAVRPLAYKSSKAALNMMTIILAKELKDTGIKVNSADPGFTATDLNHFRGTRTVEQGAAIAVKLATLPANGPTGGFFDDDGPEAW